MMVFDKAFFIQRGFKMADKRLSDIKSGDRSAFVELLTSYDPLILSECSSLLDKAPEFKGDREEMLQEGRIALYNAVMKYEDNGKVTFGLYAKICIKNRLISIKRKEKKSNSKSASYDAVSQGQIRENAKKASREKLEENEKVMSQLSSYERAVLFLYLNGHSYREIGLALKKSEKSVDNALYRIRSKLKKLI